MIVSNREDSHALSLMTYFGWTESGQHPRRPGQLDSHASRDDGTSVHEHWAHRQIPAVTAFGRRTPPKTFSERRKRCYRGGFDSSGLNSAP